MEKKRRRQAKQGPGGRGLALLVHNTIETHNAQLLNIYSFDIAFKSKVFARSAYTSMIVLNTELIRCL